MFCPCFGFVIVTDGVPSAITTPTRTMSASAAGINTASALALLTENSFHRAPREAPKVVSSD
jgi:hypothetical protein